MFWKSWERQARDKGSRLKDLRSFLACGDGSGATALMGQCARTQTALSVRPFLHPLSFVESWSSPASMTVRSPQASSRKDTVLRHQSPPNESRVPNAEHETFHRRLSVPCHADHLHEHFHEHLDISIVHVPLAPPSQLVRCDKAWTQASSRSLGTMT